MYRMMKNAAISGAALLLAASSWGQECPPCQEYEGETVTAAKAQLSEAFRLSLDVASCSDVASRDTCRQIDGLVEDVLESVNSIFSGHVEPTTVECLTCDPRPHLWPLVDGVNALTKLIVDKGGVGFTDSSQALLERLGTWETFRCPCAEETASGESGGLRRTPKRSREAEARAEIRRKCGEKFADSRMGLLQVFRVPHDREGCYQSRACREPTVYKGFQTQSGFWTYDGEFWYIWERRRGNAGRWLTCEQ
jgi:hypothetical protein